MSNLPPFFRCSGKLDPEDHNITEKLEDVRLLDEFGGGHCTLTVEIDNSEVDVILRGLSVPEGANIEVFRTAVLREVAQPLADTILSAISYEEGGNFSVRLSRVCDETFIERELGPRLNFGYDARTLKIENHIGISKDIARLALRNKWFGRAILDYSTALKWSADAPFHCYRALDSLRQHFGGDWNTMHQSLGTNYCAIYTLIQQHADSVRHARDPDYEKLARTPWYALTYVRDTLLAFMIKNDATDAYRELPVLDHGRIPDHIVTQHRGDCPQTESTPNAK
ncbi:MAG: hypothetical protein OXI05_05325 [Bacteroidota bacterium]|nr:hypothetical protein [Bacteroidota bacterium]